MTKKHFEQIAAQLAKSKPELAEVWPERIFKERLAQWNYDVVVIADACATAAPRFNRPRFYAACGVEAK